MRDSVWCFENVNLYNILCPHKLNEYNKDHFSGYNKGDVIYFPNDASRSIFLVSKGKLGNLSPFLPDFFFRVYHFKPKTPKFGF